MDFVDPITGRRTSRCFRYKRDADRFALRVEDDRDALRSGAVTPRQLEVGRRSNEQLADINQSYREQMERRQLTPAHVKESMRIVMAACDATRWVRPRDITRRSLASWLSRFTPATANSYAKKIRAWLTYLRDGEYLLDDPLVGMKTPAGEPQRKCRSLTFEEFDQLTTCSNIAPHRRFYYWLAGVTGLRHAEIGRVQWKHVDVDTRVLRLPASKAKTRRAATIPLPADLVWHLRQQRLRHPNAPMCPIGVDRRVWMRDLSRAGVAFENERGFAFRRCLRMTYATHLALTGVDLRQTQKLMRHSDPKLTANVYTDAGLMDLHGAVERLSARRKQAGA